MAVMEHIHWQTIGFKHADILLILDWVRRYKRLMYDDFRRQQHSRRRPPPPPPPPPYSQSPDHPGQQKQRQGTVYGGYVPTYLIALPEDDDSRPYPTYPPLYSTSSELLRDSAQHHQFQSHINMDTQPPVGLSMSLVFSRVFINSFALP